MPVEPTQERYRIPARQRVGLGAPMPRHGARLPSPPPVESVGSRLPARMHLGGRDRESSPPPPPSPPVQEAAGSSSRPAPHERHGGGGADGRGTQEAQRQDVGRPEAQARAPHQAADVQGARASSRTRQENSSRLAEVESVFVPRTEEINAAEAALRYALIAFISGKRAYIPLSEAGAALAARVPRAEDNFTVHRSWPADFLFVCSRRRVRDEIMVADAAHGRDFSLRFTPWNWQLQAMQCRMRFRAHFELTSVPAHAWNCTTATAILCSDAWVECLGAATANQEDLGRFQVVAWTNNVSVIPKSKEMLIEEPNDLMEEDDGLMLPGSALIPLEKTMPRYRVSVRVAHAEDILPVDDRSDGEDGGDGGEGGDGPGRRRDGGDKPYQRRGGCDSRDGRHEERGYGRGREDHRRQSHSRHRDPLRRRPSGGGGWGGSRRVALNIAAEVTPWPEVKDDDVDKVVDGVDHMHPVGPAVESSPRLSVDREAGALQQVLAAPGWATPLPTRVQLEEEDSEEGECRTRQFESVVKEPETPLTDQFVDQDHVQNCQLSSSGILPTPSFQGWTSPEESVGSVGGCSPRSVLDYFPVSVSPFDKGLQVGPTAVESVSLGMGHDFACFRSTCRKPISLVLGRPARKCRKKKVYSGLVRRSGRICGRFAAGIPIRQQQRTLMTRLGIAREGDVIGDEALDAYLDLFAIPLRQQHLDVVLRLFGWTPDDLQTASDAPVECLS
ncbi:hypothetical protein ACQ4PT_046963 [Festuca glaucescens]